MKLATIEKIKEISVHGNADSLDIVTVLGYTAIVRKNQYKVDDLVVFIQPDVVLPDAEWSKIYKNKSNRVKAIKLRGVFSFGIVESLSILPSDTELTEGFEVSDVLNIVKYEPPVPQDLAAKGNLPFGLTRTDEERYQNIRDLPFGDIVDVSLKVDGSSLTVYCKKVEGLFDYATGITSRSLELKSECENKYTAVVKKHNLIDKLKSYCEKYRVNLALRGELYGGGIQNFANNPHAKLPLGFALFNVFNLDTLKYEGIDSIHYYEKVASELNIETVPMVEKGVELTPTLIKKYDTDLTTINGNPFEGVVIKLKDGRSFKVISKDYDSKK